MDLYAYDHAPSPFSPCGVVLMGVAVLALVIANSPLGNTYFAVLHSAALELSVLH